MIVTSDSSMKVYREMMINPPPIKWVEIKPTHSDIYKIDGKNVVSIVHAFQRVAGIRKAVELIGGANQMIKDVKGSILIKPNCNTDDPYPRDTHQETVRVIANLLIDLGVKPEKIIVGDMSGRARGLPTRATMENLGITKVAEELGIKTSYFEEEDWVRVKPKKSKWWPRGIKIPKTVYEAERIIFTPILRSHSSAAFTCSLKLGVGLIDAEEREWLHNGDHFYEKMIDINLAYQVDLVIADALRMNIGYETNPEDEVTPGIITASNNMVASDAVSVALMQYYNTVRVVNTPTKEQVQFKIAQELDIGFAEMEKITLISEDMNESEEFSDIVRFIESELK